MPLCLFKRSGSKAENIDSSSPPWANGEMLGEFFMICCKSHVRFSNKIAKTNLQVYALAVFKGYPHPLIKRLLL